MIAIGGGAGGLVTAIFVFLAGGKPALIEKNLLGGDCLNNGCVPSKTLLVSAKAANIIWNASKYGIKVDNFEIDFPKVMEWVRAVWASIAKNDSVERMTKIFGIDVFLGAAKFKDDSTIEVNGKELKFDKACIATGARPRVPDIEGLNNVPYFTSE